jgi:hypothetical protein
MIRLAFQAVSGWSNNSFTKGRIWVHLSTETSLSLISVGGLFHYRRFPLFCPIFCPNISPKSLVYSEHLCYYDSMNFPSTFPPHPAPSASNHLIRFSFVVEDRIPSSPSPIGIEFYLPALVLSGNLKFNSRLRPSDCTRRFHPPRYFTGLFGRKKWACLSKKQALFISSFIRPSEKSSGKPRLQFPAHSP